MIPDLDLKRSEGVAPLDIINGPLMAGMTEVGHLFNNNELIVAEVLQSAEAMKAAVTHLQQFMEKADTATRGTIVLATVKGDVHDIGKNLVEIILANNGYQVINLGIKVPSDDLIEAWRKHHPDAIGLSGLLSKARTRWSRRLRISRIKASPCHCSSAVPRFPKNSRPRGSVPPMVRPPSTPRTQ